MTTVNWKVQAHNRHRDSHFKAVVCYLEKTCLCAKSSQWGTRFWPPDYPLCQSLWDWFWPSLFHIHPLVCFFFFIIVVQVQLSLFSRHHSPLSHLLPPPTLNPSPVWLCPWVLYTCSLAALPFISPITPLPLPLWLLSVCSLFQWLWFCFSHVFVLSIRFHLEVILLVLSWGIICGVSPIPMNVLLVVYSFTEVLFS